MVKVNYQYEKRKKELDKKRKKEQKLKLKQQKKNNPSGEVLTDVQDGAMVEAPAETMPVTPPVEEVDK